MLTGFIWLVVCGCVCGCWYCDCCGWYCSIGVVWTSLLLRGNVFCCAVFQSSKSFLRISGEGFDCLPWDIDRYCSYNANSSESSILDVPLIENSGALDAILVVIFDADDDEYNGILLVVGVLRNVDDVDDGPESGDESKRDDRVVTDGCWTVTLTRGVNVTGSGGVNGGNGDVGVDVVVEEVLVFVAVVVAAIDVAVVGFKLHLRI